MTFTELMDALTRCVVRLQRDSDDLVVFSEEETLTPLLLNGMSAYKAELLDLIDRNGGDWLSPAFTITPEMLPLARLNAAEIERIVSRVPGGAANIQDIYPLAPLQEGILFHHLMESEGDVYLTSALLSFDSRERVEKFVQALQAVIDRHDILRTAVVWEGLPEPAQVVWREAPLSVEEVSLDPEEGEIGRQLLARFNPRRYRLDVRQAPLMRGFMAYDAVGERWLLMWLNHHLTTDHTTLEIMAREAQAHLSGETERLPEPLPFRNFVAQARLGAGGIGREGHEAFFREMLGDVDEPTAPFGLTDARGDGSGLEEARLELEMGLSGRLRERARRLGVSAASLCHLAWALALARVSGRDDVVFGTVLFGRMQGGPGADRVLGLFMNTLPIRIRVDEEGVERSAKRAHRLLAELIEHEHASLALAQRCSGVEAPAPLFSSLLNYRHSPRGAEAAEAEAARSWTGISILASEERTNYPVVLSVEDLGEGLALTAQTVTQIEPWRVCGYMRTALEGLVEALESEPERAVRAIDALPEAERRQVVEEWNATEVDYLREKLIHELFEEQVQKRPDAVALAFENDFLSYSELNRRANQLAHYLRALGVEPDARVAICVERSLEMVIGLLAILKAGGAYVPLDPTYPAERLRFMLADSAPVALLTRSHLHWFRPESETRLPLLNLSAPMPPWLHYPEHNPERTNTELTPEHLIYVIHTSGSTGAPKGVMIPHRSLCNQIVALQARYGLSAQERILQFASITFDVSVEEVFGALCTGAALVLRSDSCLFSARAFWSFCERYGVSIVNLPTAFWAQTSLDIETPIPKCIRQLITGGEAATNKTWNDWFHRDGYIPVLFNAYGLTETTVNATIHEAVRDGENFQSIGRPIGNTRIYILDGHGEPAPVGVMGELYIAGAGLARGYLKRAALTSERFVADPYGEPGRRMYRTGDLARWQADGNLEFLGRADQQVKIRGFRIELGEIEARLIDHPEVREAIVAPREEEEGGKRLVAYYTGEKVGAEELRAHLSSSLPDYMAPAAYVHLESLPLTPNGKLDRRALPAPESEAYVRRGYEAPQGETERKLAQIWAETLKLERVGRRDNFFELGGHSLLALTVIERMRREGMQADVRTLFTAPTLRALAEAVRDRGENEAETPPNLIPAGCQRITPEMLPLIELTQQEIDAVAAMTPGGAANIQDIYPLTALQEGILFHHLMESEGDVYLTPALFSLDSRERVEKFVQALQAVISRHDILRTAVVWEGLPEPAQVVWREAPLSVEEVSLDPQEGEIGRQLLARFNPRRYRLDVRQAPLMRGFAAYDAVGERWLLLWLDHHLTGDHTTLEIMVREAQAHLSGEAEGLPEPLPFRNFVAQARLGIGREEHEAFFREMLGDVDEPTAPFGLTDARGDGSGLEEARLGLEMGLSNRLRERARLLRVSAASLCHLAWALVLARVSGRDDVVFGTVLFGRMQGGEGADRAPGLFMNTLPIRIRVDEEGVERSAKRAHRLLAELIAHERASLALAQRCSGVEAPAPLFSSLLNYRHSPRGTEAEGAETARSWTGVSILASEERSNYPLGLSIDDLGEGFALTAQTVASIGPWRVCGYMRRALEGMVNALEVAPETAMRAIDALPEAERRQVVEEWNATEADYPREKLIHELFEEQAERSPHAVALICEEQSLTYGELNLRANRLAHYLRGLGVEPEVRVAICLERSLEMVVALLATLKAGGTYAPLDPAYPSERLAYMLEDSAPAVLLTHGAARSALTAHTLGLCAVDLDTDAPQWAGHSKANPGRAGLNAHCLAYVIYTSGSTGAPKGVMVEHQGLCNLVEAQKEMFRLGAGAHVLQFASLSFDASVSEIFSTLAAGGSLHVYGRESLRPGDDLVRALREDQITTVTLPPSVLAALGEEELINLETVIAAGEASTTEIVERWARGRRFLDAYGPTEATVCASVGECKAGGGGRPSIGRPIKNTRLYILDGQMNPAPVGVQGELYIAGVGLARGYMGRPEQTAERFIPDLFNAEGGGRLYRTGDVVRYLKNGELEFIGRADDQVKVRGYRIELGEIGAVLNEHGSVKQSVVVAREDERGDKRLIGYVVGEAGARSAELKRYVRERLPEYMVPDAIVLLEEMPLTANGKIDWKRLPSVFSLKDAGRQVEQEYVASRTPLEEMVVGIFEETLKLDRVGIHDNFFEIGGHSLSAIQVISRVRSAFEVEIGVRSVFEEPTAEGLGRKIEEAMGAGEKTKAPPIVRVPRVGKLPLSFAQLRLWFLDQLAPNSPLYNCPGAVRFAGRMDLEIWERVISEIVRRHESLRTRFEAEEGEPVQVIEEWEPRRLELMDLTGLPPEERKEEASRIAREEAETGFDLSRGPLLRVKVLKLEEEEHVVLYTMHHIVSDAWSMGVLTREVETLYRAYSMGGAGIAGDESPLEELEIQYADFAVWQRAYLAGEVLEREIGYWREQLKDAAVLELPTDRPRPAELSYRGGMERLELDHSLSEGLRKLSHKEGVTLFMTLMAAFKALLMRYGGQEDISVGTVIANRTRREVEGLIGFFVNTLVMRTDLSGNPSFRELVKREREVALGAYAHQELPFEKLVEELNPERDLSRNPLFQIMMTMQNAGGETSDVNGVEPGGIRSEVKTMVVTQAAQFDLTLTITDLRREMAGTVEYSRDLFEAGTIERLINHYTNLLNEIARDSERPISELSLMSDQEREQVIFGWNETAGPYPEDRCVHHLFERQMERAPEAVAVVSDEGCLSYGELNRRANQLARYLQRRGVGPEVVVGVCLERSVEMAVGLLGALKAGGAYLPLDPTYPAERLSFMLEDAAAQLIVTLEKLGSLFVATPAELICLDSSREEIVQENEENVESEVRSEDLAYVIYTSGSTGLPKGTMITHRSVVNLVTDAVRKFRLGPESRFLQFASLSFDVAVEEIYPVWSIGGSVVLLSDEASYSYSELTETIERHEVTTVELPTAYWREWMRELLRDHGRAPRCLDLVITGDEKITADVFREWKEHEVSLLHVYGVTEATVNSIVYQVPGDFGEGGSQATIPIGKPIANTEVYLLDDRLQPMPLGIPGEMYLGGAGLARGYLKRPELTAERFAPSPFGNRAGSRLYRSGDLARSSESGCIEFIGRADTQVKLRGYRIELGEIESQLARHPAIKEAVALVREDNPGDKRLVAYYTVTATGGAKSTVEAETLRGYLSTALPGYMIPAAYVELESLPLGPSGKLDRRTLPQPDGAGAARKYEAPVGDVETTLARIWAEALKVDRVGRHDNFFALGGHSLLALRLIERMRSEGLQTDVRTLFITRTLAELAAGMEKMKEIIL